MRFDIVTIFPEFFSGPLEHGIVRRAREAGIAEVHLHDLRDFTHDHHRSVDDRPFGGGEGMVLKPEPLFNAVESLLGRAASGASTDSPPARHESRVTNHESPVTSRQSLVTSAVVLLSASGKLFRQETARGYAQLERMVLLCGRYEGVDERVAEHLATEEISIGDFVLSGGELAAALVVDAITRLLPGALGNEASSIHESFSVETPASNQPSATGADKSVITGHRPPATVLSLLDCPHYTRQQVFRSWSVPDVLVSGNHEEIRRWRRKMALAKTARNRPDLLASAAISDEDRLLLAEIRNL